MPTHWKPITTALLAGAAIGWIDAQATEVQGSLLLLILVAFVAALASRAPAWLLAMSLVAGMVAANLVAAATGRGTVNFTVAIVFLPVIISAVFGRGLKLFVDGSVRAFRPDAASNASAIDNGLRSSLLLLTITGCAALGIVPVYAVSIARGQPVTWFVVLIWQATTFIAWIGMSPKLLTAGRSMNNLDGIAIGVRDIAVHCSTVVGIVVLHAVVLPLLQLLLHIPIGPGGFQSATVWALAAYLPLDALTYVLLLAVGRATDANRRIRLSAMLEEAFRGQQATMRLASLQAQLRPHFLFNALNAGAVLAKRGDAEGAARVLTGLGDLLRYVLRGSDDAAESGTQLVRLGEEISFAQSYLALEHERFPDRLQTTSNISDEVCDALIPHLLVQPLVENAVKHGIGSRVGPGVVALRAWREEGILHIAVDDDGPGLGSTADDADSHGIGITNTRNRLLALYGTSATLTLQDCVGGGVSAHVSLPFST